MTNRTNMILQAKVRHSDACILQGPDSEDAIYAQNVIYALENSPVERLICHDEDLPCDDFEENDTLGL
jgi:hypothetical protein